MASTLLIRKRRFRVVGSSLRVAVSTRAGGTEGSARLTISTRLAGSGACDGLGSGLNGVFT